MNGTGKVTERIRTQITGITRREREENKEKMRDRGRRTRKREGRKQTWVAFYLSPSSRVCRYHGSLQESQTAWACYKRISQSISQITKERTQREREKSKANAFVTCRSKLP